MPKMFLDCCNFRKALCDKILRFSVQLCRRSLMAGSFWNLMGSVRSPCAGTHSVAGTESQWLKPHGSGVRR